MAIIRRNKQKQELFEPVVWSPNNVPNDWYVKLLALIPEGCRPTQDCEAWLQEQYRLGRSPEFVFGELHIIEF